MKKNLTHISSVTSKYQTVVPSSVRKAIGIEENQELFWRVVQTGKFPMVMVTLKPKDWAEHAWGLGKEVWENVNGERYINQLRAEWEK